MRDLLGLAAVLLIVLSSLGAHRAGEVDPPAIDAGLAQSAAWMEAETSLPRLLIYVRCAIDRWMVETDGRRISEVEPPRMDLEDWESEISAAARLETAARLSASAEVRLSRNPGPGGLDLRLNRAFRGGMEEGMIRVRGSLNISVYVERGMGEASAVRNYTFTVVHPLKYYLIVEAHSEASEAIDEVRERAVFTAGTVDSPDELFEASGRAVDRVMGELRGVERRLRREYSRRGIAIELTTVPNGSSLEIVGRGDLTEVILRVTLLVRVWVEDPQVRYWWGEERVGWGCYSERSVSVVTVGWVEGGPT